MSARRRTRPNPAAGTRAARKPALASRRRRTFIERYRGPILGGIAIVVILALAVIFVLKFGPNSQGKEAAAGAQPADPALLSELTQIPPATFDAVGAGSASNGPKALSGATPLQQDGKPEVLYVGAEYCPYCAAERWAVIVALSRFGNFGNLHTTRSATGDVFPGTPTFTFYQSTYASQYLALSAVEQYTNQPSGNGYTSLQSLSSSQQSVVDKYNKQPYTPGGIPFVDFGNKYVFSGATYGPGVLANLDWQQIATKLSDPSTAQAQGILGSANLISAAVCQLTSQQPGDVCSSPGVQKASALLGKS
jgi:hypothetical protein